MRDDIQKHHSLRLRLPETEIIPFPANARVGKIRRLAEMMDGTTARHANALWHQAIDGMRRQMERAGVTDDRIDAELRNFFQAVQSELLRRSHGMASIDGGDAA